MPRTQGTITEARIVEQGGPHIEITGSGGLHRARGADVRASYFDSKQATKEPRPGEPGRGVLGSVLAVVGLLGPVEGL